MIEPTPLWQAMNPWHKDEWLTQSEQRTFAYLMLACVAGLLLACCAAVYFIIVLILDVT